MHNNAGYTLNVSVGFDTEAVWEYNFPGVSLTVEPARIPADILEFIIRDRIGNKIKDVWADSSKVPLNDRAAAGQRIIDSIYAGNWDSRGRPKTWDEYVAKAAEMAAESWFGKAKTKKDSKGILRNVESPADIAFIAGIYADNQDWRNLVRVKYDQYLANRKAATVRVTI